MRIDENSLNLKINKFKRMGQNSICCKISDTDNNHIVKKITKNYVTLEDNEKEMITENYNP